MRQLNSCRAVQKLAEAIHRRNNPGHDFVYEGVVYNIQLPDNLADVPDLSYYAET